MKNIDVIKKLAEQHDTTMVQAEKMLKSVVDIMADAVKTGDSVDVSGFGTFKLKEVKARKGRNPKTGATIDIAASRKMVFAPAKKIRDSLNA